MQQPPEITLPKPTLDGFKNPFTGLTHIMTTEDREAQSRFVREFIHELDPRGRAELHFARTVALDSWRLNRMKAVEENVFAYGQVLPNRHFTHAIPQVEHAVGHAHTFMLYCKAINILSLYESRLNRTIQRNLELLLKLQATRSQRNTNSQTEAAPIAVAMPAHTAAASAAATTEEQPKAA